MQQLDRHNVLENIGVIARMEGVAITQHREIYLGKKWRQNGAKPVTVKSSRFADKPILAIPRRNTYLAFYLRRK
jgi:hypothetical protein